MNDELPTPRTDEAWENAEGPAINIADVMRAKCKELERELALSAATRKEDIRKCVRLCLARAEKTSKNMTPYFVGVKCAEAIRAAFPDVFKEE